VHKNSFIPFNFKTKKINKVDAPDADKSVRIKMEFHMLYSRMDSNARGVDPVGDCLP
jgi:hypothetical protein